MADLDDGGRPTEMARRREGAVLLWTRPKIHGGRGNDRGQVRSGHSQGAFQRRYCPYADCCALCRDRRWEAVFDDHSRRRRVRFGAVPCRAELETWVAVSLRPDIGQFQNKAVDWPFAQDALRVRDALCGASESVDPYRPFR